MVVFFLLLKVVPSQISNLERTRGEYQDYGFFRVRYLRNVWKEPCRGCGFVTFVAFLRIFDVLGFAKKSGKKYIPCDKNLEMSQSSKLWHCDIWKCHKMSHFFKSWYTFYVWIGLRMALIVRSWNIQKRGSSSKPNHSKLQFCFP